MFFEGSRLSSSIYVSTVVCIKVFDKGSKLWPRIHCIYRQTDKPIPAYPSPTTNFVTGDIINHTVRMLLGFPISTCTNTRNAEFIRESYPL